VPSFFVYFLKNSIIPLKFQFFFSDHPLFILFISAKSRISKAVFVNLEVEKYFNHPKKEDLVMAVGESMSMAFDYAKNAWQNFDLQKWAEGIGGSSAEAVMAASYFFLSFGIGFAFKKYFKYIFMCLIFTIFVIKAMEYKEFLIIDWDAIEQWLGWTRGQPLSLGSMSDAIFDWLKNHILVAVASLVGFLVGYKLG